MYKKLTILLLLPFFALSFAACESTTAPSMHIIDTTIVTKSDRALFALNEGAFGHSNGSLDVMLFHHTIRIHDSANFSDTTVIDTMYHTHRDVLTGLGLGNDILINGNQVVVLDNGSNQLIIVDADSLKQLTTIPLGLDAPSKMALIGPNLLLVTKRSATNAAIIDLTNNVVVDTIGIGEPSIAIAVLGNKAFVTSSAMSYAAPYHINVIDVATRRIVNRYTIGGSPEQALADSANNQVIVGAPGDYVSFPVTFYFLNATTGALTDSVVAGSATDDAELTDGSEKFVIRGSDVFRPFGSSHQLGTKIISGGTSFYKGYFDASLNALYLGKYDFTSSGQLYMYNPATGAIENSFATGIAPAHFAFYH